MNKEQIVFIAAVIKGMPEFAPSLRTQRASCARAFMNAIAWKAEDFDSEQFLIDCGVNEPSIPSQRD
jgi:transposase